MAVCSRVLAFKINEVTESSQQIPGSFEFRCRHCSTVFQGSAVPELRAHRSWSLLLSSSPVVSSDGSEWIWMDLDGSGWMWWMGFQFCDWYLYLIFLYCGWLDGGIDVPESLIAECRGGRIRNVICVHLLCAALRWLTRRSTFEAPPPRPSQQAGLRLLIQWAVVTLMDRSCQSSSSLSSIRLQKCSLFRLIDTGSSLLFTFFRA